MMLLNSSRVFVCLTATFLFAASVVSQSSAATITLNSDRDLVLLRTTVNNTPSAAPNLVQQLNDVNLGGGGALQTGTAGSGGSAGEVRSLVSFDQNLIPIYESIDSLTLRLYFRSANSNISGADPFNVEVHSVSAANADWVEGTGVGNGAVTDNIGSNWNRKNEVGAVNWAGGTGTTATGGLLSAGTDYNVTTLASVSFTNPLPIDGTPIDFNFTGTSAQLTNLINSWDTANGGFLLFHNNPASLGTNIRVLFHTKENGNPFFQPQLIVGFTPQVPEPSSLMLMSLSLVGLSLARKRSRRS